MDLSKKIISISEFTGLDLIINRDNLDYYIRVSVDVKLPITTTEYSEQQVLELIDDKINQTNYMKIKLQQFKEIVESKDLEIEDLNNRIIELKKYETFYELYKGLKNGV